MSGVPGEVRLESAYSISIYEGDLTVWSECCCEKITTVEKARAVIALCNQWIGQQPHEYVDSPPPAPGGTCTVCGTRWVDHISRDPID